MRFLCLHGSGTNSEVLEMQTAAVRYELGENHTYEYIDGMIAEKIAPEIEKLYPTNGEFYSYFNDEPETCIQALTDLSRYIETDGPFDGVICFSVGASLAATLLLHHAKDGDPNSKLHPPFKLAVFFSATLPADPELLVKMRVRRLVDTADVPLIRIPTAHIWGCNDAQWSSSSEKLALLCIQHSRNIFVHGGGHEIPGARDKAAVLGAAHAIQRAIDAALMAQ